MESGDNNEEFGNISMLHDNTEMKFMTRSHDVCIISTIKEI